MAMSGERGDFARPGRRDREGVEAGVIPAGAGRFPPLPRTATPGGPGVVVRLDRGPPRGGPRRPGPQACSRGSISAAPQSVVSPMAMMLMVLPSVSMVRAPVGASVSGSSPFAVHGPLRGASEGCFRPAAGRPCARPAGPGIGPGVEAGIGSRGQPAEASADRPGISRPASPAAS